MVLSQAKNSSGESCIAAATQSTFSSLGVEAGIHAVEQLFLKHSGQALFRPNALVNIIFVSDTHDPGINSQQLKDARASYAELLDLASVDNRIASLKFHALAPVERCTGEDFTSNRTLLWWMLPKAKRETPAYSQITRIFFEGWLLLAKLQSQSSV